MKVWACLELRSTGPLGLASRAGEEIAGRSVLARTAARCARARRLEGVAVLVEPAGSASARAALGAGAEGVRILEVLQPDLPRREALRRARKWARDSWRGGLKQTMELDAAGHFPSLAAAARELGADAVLAVLPEAVMVDPGILDGLIEHGAPRGQPPLPSAICQAPAGFAGLFAMAGWLEPMAARDLTYGQMLAWAPGKSSVLPDARAENYLAPTPVRRCEFRGAVDSARSRELLGEILGRAPGEDGLGPGAEEAAALVAACPALYAGRLPRIVEVELTSMAKVPFRDTPAALESRAGQMSRGLFEKLLGDLAAYDDMLLTLGGPGDPLAHPEVFEFLGLARREGIYGLHLDTPGPLLDEAAAEKLLEQAPDVVSVRLGAATAETYHALTGRGDFEKTVANIKRLVELRGQTGREWPFVVVEAEKRLEAEGELLDLVDRWTGEVDCVVLRPFSDYAGQLADRAPVHLTLAGRLGCRRLMKEMLVLADGTVPVCRMDFRAEEPAGNIAEKSVGELWTGGSLAGLRAEQHREKFDGFRLCPACRDWDNV